MSGTGRRFQEGRRLLSIHGQYGVDIRKVRGGNEPEWSTGKRMLLNRAVWQILEVEVLTSVFSLCFGDEVW